MALRATPDDKSFALLLTLAWPGSPSYEESVTYSWLSRQIRTRFPSSANIRIHGKPGFGMEGVEFTNGVIEFDVAGKAISLEEKPAQPKSRYAIPGLYFCDGQACSIARSLKPSTRGELEIVDLLKRYLATGSLHVQMMGRGRAWLDTGTPDSLLEAAQFIQTIEKRQGLKIACPEEIAFRMGHIDASRLEQLAAPLKGSRYGDYLLSILRERG